MNLAKKDLFYSKGMKIAMHSELGSNAWFRGGEDIKYTRNKFTNSRKPFYILSFTYEFLYNNVTVSIAFAEPYSYTDIKRDIEYFEKIANKKYKFIRELLCTTVGGCNCEIITFTSNKVPNENKKVAILTSRVHPGETVGSWMMKGILEFLTSGSSIADLLLEKYIFKIVPCLNPDGVIQGNYRCSLSGSDLNRKYVNPSSILHPAIYYTKLMVRNLSNPIAFYCDLHGHSKKKDVFVYGNTGEDLFEYKIFPYILSKINSFFSFKSSKFSVNKSKASTARIAMWRELHIPTVYTIEASFYGPSSEQRHFDSNDLMKMGHSICHALLLYSNSKEIPELKSGNLKEVNLLKRIIAEFKVDPEVSVNDESDSSGSDSNPPENEADMDEIINSISSRRKLRNEIKNSFMKKSMPMNIQVNEEINVIKGVEKTNESKSIVKNITLNEKPKLIPLKNSNKYVKVNPTMISFHRKKTDYNDSPHNTGEQRSVLKKAKSTLFKKASKNKSIIYDNETSMIQKYRSKEINLIPKTSTNMFNATCKNPFPNTKSITETTKGKNNHKYTNVTEQNMDNEINNEIHIEEKKIHKDQSLTSNLKGLFEYKDISKNPINIGMELNKYKRNYVDFFGFIEFA